MENYIKIYQKWINSEELQNSDKNELLAIAGNDNEIKERFGMELAFGTAGMRGVLGMGTNRMNVFTVRRATKGLADYISGLGSEAMKKGVVIAYDTRRFSVEFAAECAGVLAANKINCYIFEDVRPVPMCSFAVRHLGATAGIMITASHNPKQYNGYKVYGADGAQMSPEATAEVVRFIEKADVFGIDRAAVLSKDDLKGKNGYKAGEYVTVIGKDVDEKYFEAISALSVSPDAVKKFGKKVKLVYTPLHGSGYMPVTSVLGRKGINVSVVREQALPDPDFSTVKVPNPEEQSALALAIAQAEREGAGVVIGTDPDADRMGVALKTQSGYAVLTGNQIGVLMMDYILSSAKEQGKLPANAAVIKTIVSTNLANKVAGYYGATIFEVLTGFKFIGEKIKEWEQSGEYTYMFGFEESYGSLVGTHARDKDAVVAAMIFSEMVCKYESLGTTVTARLEELYAQFGYYCEKGASFVFEGLDGMDKMNAIMEKVRADFPDEIAGRQVEFKRDYLSGITRYADGAMENITLPKSNVIYFGLEGGDWICVRPSGTEPKLKIYVADSRESADKAAEANAAYLEAVKNAYIG